MGELSIFGRRYLRRGGDERTHQIHIFEMRNKADIEEYCNGKENFMKKLEQEALFSGKIRKF